MVLPLIINSLSLSSFVVNTNTIYDYSCTSSVVLTSDNLTNGGSYSPQFIEENYNTLVLQFGSLFLETPVLEDQYGDIDLSISNLSYTATYDDLLTSTNQWSQLRFYDIIFIKFENFSELTKTINNTLSVHGHFDDGSRVYDNRTRRCYLRFDNYDHNYDNAYSSGYNLGVVDGIEQQAIETQSWKSNYDNLKVNYDDLLARYNTLLKSEVNFNTLIWNIATLPFESFKIIWNVDFLGVNLGSLVMGLMSVGVILFVWKKFIK